MEPIILWTEDGDERNARPLIVNHQRPGQTIGINRPGGAPPVRHAPVVLYPSAPVAPMAPVAPVAPMAPVAASGALWQPGVGWVQNAPAGQVPSALGSKLGQLATPGLVQALSMLIASFLPVPPPPTATGSVEDDVANGITYQAALAAHAKTDEKLRAFGFALAQIV